MLAGQLAESSGTTADGSGPDQPELAKKQLHKAGHNASQDYMPEAFLIGVNTEALDRSDGRLLLVLEDSPERAVEAVRRVWPMSKVQWTGIKALRARQLRSLGCARASRNN